MYLLGKPLIYWTMRGLAENGVNDIVVVCSPQSTIPEMLQQENDLDAKITYVTQREPLGTGNALWQAREFIREPCFVVWPNKVNSKFIVLKILEKVMQESSNAVLVGAETETPWLYGVVKFNGEKVAEIVENPAQGQEPSRIKVIGFYFFEPSYFGYYEKLPRHHEADHIDALNQYLREKNCDLVLLDKDVPALKYPWELFGILDILFGTDYFKVSVSPTAIIEEEVVIKGDVHIGENTRVKAHTVIEGPCFIGDNCEIGYGNVLRGPLDIENEVKTGAFCEIKHTIVQQGTHVHSGYIGDSIVGRDCRFGAGFTTANRRLDRQNIKALVKGEKVDTGLSFFGAVVGDGAHFGIHSGTMPGVFVGSGCVIGPGTFVFENLPNKTVLYTKPDQEQKPIST